MRGKKAKTRKMSLDVKYNNHLVARLINKVMQDGRKSLAEKLVYNALDSAAKETKLEPVDFLNQVVEKIRPSLEVKPRRIGGANYSVPVPVTPVRQETLAIRWIVDSARAKGGSKFDEILKKELIDSFNEQGEAFNKKVNMEKMAEANKAFAHFKW